jgi:iron complex transport system permease protein
MAARFKPSLYFITILVLLSVSLVAAIAVGSVNISSYKVINILLSTFLPLDPGSISESEKVIIIGIRAPRVIVAALVGAALAIAGTQMQGLFQNPLASPDIIGTSSGGALGAIIALATGLAIHSEFYLPLFSFICSVAVIFTVYAISTSGGKTPVATLLLVGLAFNALIGSVISFLITLTWIDIEVTQQIIFWLLGGLDNRTWTHVAIALPGLLIGVVVSFFYTRELDLLLLGEETASSLGVDVESVKRIVLTTAALLTGTAVAVSGIIGFVGLVIPHICRIVVGPRHAILLPASALTGSFFIIVADLIARTIISPQELRLGIITSLFGAPFFLYLLVRRRFEAGYR